MFSGITQGLFPVSLLLKREGLFRYAIDLNENLIKDLKVGASVAIDGVCQTVVNIDGLTVSFDAMSETLAATTLGALDIDKKVSVERSLRLGEEIGGHEVAGHVFEQAIIIGRRELTDHVSLSIQCSDGCFAFIKPRGFVAIDGSSLTVAALSKKSKSFEVYIIPETLRVTNFVNKGVGSRVNLEPDMKVVALVEAVQASLADIQTRVDRIEKKLRYVIN